MNSGIDPKQSKLNLRVRKSVDPQRKKRYDAGVTEFNVCDGRPFELSVGAGLQKLCKKLTDSGYVPPHPTTISRKVREVANSIEHKIRSELRDVVANNHMLSATFDHWKADNQKNFMVINVHFLNTSYELKSYSIGIILNQETWAIKLWRTMNFLMKRLRNRLSYNLFFLFTNDTTSVMPATANIITICSSERTNSVGSTIISDLRHSLSDYNAEALIFLKKNRDMFLAHC